MVSTRVERAHNAVKTYIDPRLQRGASVDCRSFFTGIDDANLAEHIPSIVGAIARATAGVLAMDASEPELHQTLKKIADEPDGTRRETKGEIVDESIVDRILALLQMKISPVELAAVRQILTQPSKKQRAAANNPEEIGEDARNARVAYDQRFPSAARIKFEPAMTPEPQRQTPPDLGAYYSRFPSARRIGQ